MIKYGKIKMVITMQEKEQVIQAQALLLILTVVSVFASDVPYLCILFAGLLMILFTLRSLSDEVDRLTPVAQILLSSIFASVGGGWLFFLIFYECRIFKNRWGQIVLPSVAYCFGSVILRKESLPQIILNALILAVLSGGLKLIEQVTMSYILARMGNSHAVTVAAVNEMYEKKLNRELTIKNYLADKNARLEERENISRNIHNSVGHSITAAIMTLDAADMLFDTNPDKAREKMNTANERIRTGLSAIRHAVRVLDRESEFISMTDFISELNAVIDNFVMDTTLAVAADFSDVGRELQIPHEHTEFLTGAMQELLTNGVRHGNADSFCVSLTADSGHIKLAVSDNGDSDFSEENRQERIQNGFGLKKLISYAGRCGGSAVFLNENGFRTEITLPLTEHEDYKLP